MALTDRQIANLRKSEKPYKISDGGGLFLLVTPAGGKLWRLAYRIGQTQKLLSFGPYPSVGLADARARRDAAKRDLANGSDPGFRLKQEKHAKAVANANTFADIAADFMAKNEREGKSEATLGKKRWLIELASGDIGNRPITDITAAEVLVPLRRIEAKGNLETARRLRATISQIFRYAIATARAENDPTFGLKGAIVAGIGLEGMDEKRARELDRPALAVFIPPRHHARVFDPVHF